MCCCRAASIQARQRLHALVKDFGEKPGWSIQLFQRFTFISCQSKVLSESTGTYIYDCSLLASPRISVRLHNHKMLAILPCILRECKGIYMIAALDNLRASVCGNDSKKKSIKVFGHDGRKVYIWSRSFRGPRVMREKQLQSPPYNKWRQELFPVWRWIWQFG